MSDESPSKRPRAPINALKVLNQLREQKGLPKIATKQKAVRITPEIKKEVTLQELQRLFPEALTAVEYEFNDEQAKRLVKEVDFRLTRIKAGKDPAPDVGADQPSGRQRS